MTIAEARGMRGRGWRSGAGLSLLALLLTSCDASKSPPPAPARAAPPVASQAVARQIGLPTDTFLDRDDATELRIITYNVNWNAIFADVDAARAARFARLAAALNPDVFVLQEIGMHPQERGKAGSRKRTAADVLTTMKAILPPPPGQNWHAFQGGDNVIVSRYPLKLTAQEPTPPGEREMALALVDLPDERFTTDLYLLGVHFKCCGGTDNDPQRQRQSDAIAAWLRDARSPGNHIDLPPATPFMILGDLNLVGGPQPLLTLTTGDIVDEGAYGADFAPDWDDSALTDAHPRHNVSGPDDYTWRDDKQQYDPGRLDYVIYSDSVLTVTKSFVLNTTAMSEPDLRACGLERFDTTMDGVGKEFDHLPLIVDLRFSP